MGMKLGPLSYGKNTDWVVWEQIYEEIWVQDKVWWAGFCEGIDKLSVSMKGA
jgi:hypothetical protein